MYFVKVALFAAFIAIVNADPVARISGGQEVDNLRQFPHHVEIIPYEPNPQMNCGGSILNAQWILTTARCVKDALRLELNFGKKKKYDEAAPFFSISVNSDQVYVYPTYYDNLALVKLPIQLVFSDTISPVNISKLSTEELRNKFAVMPGFIDGPYLPLDTVTLHYGMFNVLDQSYCRQELGTGVFDEYTQICTDPWGGDTTTICSLDYGSGLVIGWPAKSELIGLFTLSQDCSYNRPFVYTYVKKYLPWIESMISGY